MANNYDNSTWDNPTQMTRQRDLVLSTNEFCFLQSKTNGAIKTHTGPTTMTISAQESLVVFNSKTKKFEETQDFEKAKQLFISAPEGWYVVLKNPAADGSHPEAAKAVNSPELEIGRKINIAGPVSFSLFPGQMSKVIRGHRLRSNQYLIARVYDAEAAKRESATIVNAEGKEVTTTPEEYFVGQLIVIKGTEVSFYIPPTGIEVIPVNAENGENTYVRDAVTLERLEYAILKDEDGEKRYIHGPSVVFPKPTETFVNTPSGGTIFRALELSPISGIYVKVIAEYNEIINDKTIKHPIGEELFITGNDQMIYYPRPEHAIIQYDGKYMHHAIAIPEGEGRYVLNRLTGEITTIKGPQMYLPDPRKEVIVKRKLTTKECQLMYPNNTEVLTYNDGLTEKSVEKAAKKGLLETSIDLFNVNANNTTFATTASLNFDTMFSAAPETNANISRGTSYTKPRTITLDTKYEGVVTIDVWTGYAINVVSKSGKRDVVIGPATRLLNYDETVEAIELSCGQPKTTDKTIQTAFLKTENNKVSDIITAETADFVTVQINLSYYVDFLKEYSEKWFSINNYVKYLCDTMRSIVKREIKKYNIKDFYADSTNILRNVVLDITTTEETSHRVFEENGMFVNDVDIISISMEQKIANLLEAQRNEIIQKTIELSNAEAQLKTIEALADAEKQKAQIQNETTLYKAALEQKRMEEKLSNDEIINEMKRVAKEAELEAENNTQELLNAIQAAKLAREQKETDATIAYQKEQAAIEKAKEEAHAAVVERIMNSISPDLIAAITTGSQSELLKSSIEAISPYALAGENESISDVVNKLTRGTPLEQIINNKLFNTTD